MSFNFEKLGQSLQKLSQTMLQGTMLFAANDMRKHGRTFWGGGCGMYGPSIWGCRMPSPNLYHPMYSDGYTCPALTQQGILSAGEYGAQLFQKIKSEQSSLQGIQPQNSDIQDETPSKEFENNLKTKGEHTFAPDMNTDDNDSITEDEKNELEKKYLNSVTELSMSYLSSVDEKHGDNKSDKKLTLDEFKAFAKDKFGSKATDEKIALAFSRLDVDQNNSITVNDMVTAFTVMDEITENKDGKITIDDYNKFVAALADEKSNVSELLKVEFANYFNEDKAK